MFKNIIIFGGSGFIGRALVDDLLSQNHSITIICSKYKKAVKNLPKNKNLQIKVFDIFNEEKLKEELKNQDFIINLIGKLFARKKDDFEKFHSDFPKLISRNINANQQLIHISALGIEQSSKTSLYAKSKLIGEENIKKYCDNYIIIRPSVVFGKNDNFFNLFAKIAKFSPFLPLIGGGKNLFAPILVNDLVKTITTLINKNRRHQRQILQAYGPKTASFKQILKFILQTAKKRRLLLFLPYRFTKFYANFLNFFKIFIITADQVELLKYDNIGDEELDNIDQIIGKLEDYEEVVPDFIN